MSNTPEYERGYKNGTKDCHALYGMILDRICMALDEKGEKEQAKEARKIFAGEKMAAPDKRCKHGGGMPKAEYSILAKIKRRTRVLLFL